jgi:pilus assembly protein CpaF
VPSRQPEQVDRSRDPLLLPLRPDPPGTPRQRGSISEARDWLLRMQLRVADHIRVNVLAPDVPLDMPLERTPDNEKKAMETIAQLTNSGKLRFPERVSRKLVVFNILNEVFSLGPLEPLLEPEEVTEVMVNGPYIIYIERGGKLLESGHKFLDDEHLERIIKRIIKPLGREVSYDHPLVDARLGDGSRVNAVIRPCSIDGPSITVRKFAKHRFTMEDLMKFGSLSKKMAYFLRALVLARQNIVVSGGTGSGKTTLVNALSAFIPEEERIVTIEDAAELSMKQRHVVRLETKRPSVESPTEVTIRDLIKNSLRMRPERIVIGECRSGEALDMLQAMNTGHDGSITTVHSNNPRDCISRLETLVLMSGVDLPVLVVRRQIASAVHWIVQASRLRDGSRKITHITEVQRMEGDVVILNPVFEFDDEGDGANGKVRGTHIATGTRPGNRVVFEQYGIKFKSDFFT